MVSQLLGHSSKETTEQIYLAPVRHLPLELFLNEAAGEIESPQDLPVAGRRLGQAYPGCGAVTSAQQRTAAVAPEAGYSRPRLVEPDGLSVLVRTEDGDTRDVRFQFGRCAARPEWAARGRVREGVRARRHLATDGDGPKRLEGTAALLGVRRRRAPGCDHDHGRDRGCVWKTWRESTYTASGRNGSSRVLRTLLREAEGLPARTRMALNGRIEENVERQTDAYTRDEMATYRHSGAAGVPRCRSPDQRE